MDVKPYIQTHSGIKFEFLDPSPEQIRIEDIAFSLSNQCRFCGHIKFVSVAEHSISVASRLNYSDQLAGLLHDASEAYLSDIPSPVKDFLPDYFRIEQTVQQAINKKFGVDTFTQAVKAADRDATYTEAHYLLKDGGKDWVPSGFKPNIFHHPVEYTPAQAYEVFMNWFEHLTKTWWSGCQGHLQRERYGT